jgi:hypothetical protein
MAPRSAGESLTRGLGEPLPKRGDARPRRITGAAGRRAFPALDPRWGHRYGSAVPPTIDKRVHELGDGLYAYLMTPGTWGWSNSGLIEDGGQALLVDTLFDTANTRSMLDALDAVTPAARSIGTVVNTHANGDHCWGNALLPQAEVIASKACAEEMLELPPARMALLMRAARITSALGPFARGLRSLFEAIGVTSVSSFLRPGRISAAPGDEWGWEPRGGLRW